MNLILPTASPASGLKQVRPLHIIIGTSLNTTQLSRFRRDPAVRVGTSDFGSGDKVVTRMRERLPHPIVQRTFGGERQLIEVQAGHGRPAIIDIAQRSSSIPPRAHATFGADCGGDGEWWDRIERAARRRCRRAPSAGIGRPLGHVARGSSRKVGLARPTAAARTAPSSVRTPWRPGMR